MSVFHMKYSIETLIAFDAIIIIIIVIPFYRTFLPAYIQN